MRLLSLEKEKKKILPPPRTLQDVYDSPDNEFVSKVSLSWVYHLSCESHSFPSPFSKTMKQVLKLTPLRFIYNVDSWIKNLALFIVISIVLLAIREEEEKDFQHVCQTLLLCPRETVSLVSFKFRTTALTDVYFKSEAANKSRHVANSAPLTSFNE